MEVSEMLGFDELLKLMEDVSREAVAMAGDMENVVEGAFAVVIKGPSRDYEGFAAVDRAVKKEVFCRLVCKAVLNPPALREALRRPPVKVVYVHPMVVLFVTPVPILINESVNREDIGFAVHFYGVPVVVPFDVSMAYEIDVKYLPYFNGKSVKTIRDLPADKVGIPRPLEDIPKAFRKVVNVLNSAQWRSLLVEVDCPGRSVFMYPRNVLGDFLRSLMRETEGEWERLEDFAED